MQEKFDYFFQRIEKLFPANRNKTDSKLTIKKCYIANP